MRIYLIVWGSAADQIRVGEGETEEAAAKAAFGSYDERAMTLVQVSARELKIDYRRTRLCYDLLTIHANRMFNYRREAVVKAEEVMSDLLKRNQKVWRRYGVMGGAL